MNFSYCSGNAVYGRGRFPGKTRLFMAETNKFIYIVCNYNYFKDFYAPEKDTMPVWLSEVYKIKKLGKWYFVKGRKVNDR